jgi:2'-5' RNA ligase
MARIAVDAVLLPEEKMMDRALEINRQLVRNYHSEIVLNKESCVPHISLAMGCLDEADLDTAANVLRGLAQGTAVRRLEIVGVLRSTNSRGETTSVLEIAKTAELQTLHERIMRELEPFLTHDVTADMISDDTVAPSTLDWIRNYAREAAFAHFTPHLTLGYGTVQPDRPFPITFRATRLALCHLGNHGTCRRILASADLP